jgi:hypothetical protein
MPDLDDRLLDRTADWPLDIFFAFAAVSLLAWLTTGERWLLFAYGAAVAAMLASKREGQLLAACLVVGGLVATAASRRRDWPVVVGVTALAYVPAIPWRIWWSSRHLQSDAPPGGFLHGTFGNGSRIGPSFHLVLRLLFDYHLWLAAVPIAIAAALLCVGLAGDRRPAAFFLSTLLLGIIAWAWVNWSDPSLPITTDAALNPTDRAVGSLALLSIVASPVLVAQLLGQRVAALVPAAR